MNLMGFFAEVDIQLTSSSVSEVGKSSSSKEEPDLPETIVTGFNQWQTFNNWG